MRAAQRQDWLLPIMLGLIGMAWVGLLLWGRTPYSRYLQHGGWAEPSLSAPICQALPGAGLVLAALLYTGGWVLMIAATMLPTVFPLLNHFERMAAGRRDRAALVAFLIAGYLLSWTGFGLGAHALDTALHAAGTRSVWLVTHAWLPGAILLTLAGLFQFSRLKYRCLDQCRAPLSFIIRHWRGTAPRRDAFRLGLRHGMFCVGCCWAIMLLMFVVGTGNVGWMLLLGAVMAIEKNAAWGRQLGRPLGAALIGWATLIVVSNLAVSF
jgi:predicted metal-binding membrane protein